PTATAPTPGLRSGRTNWRPCAPAPPAEILPQGEARLRGRCLARSDETEGVEAHPPKILPQGGARLRGRILASGGGLAELLKRSGGSVVWCARSAVSEDQCREDCDHHQADPERHV